MVTNADTELVPGELAASSVLKEALFDGLPGVGLLAGDAAIEKAQALDALVGPRGSPADLGVQRHNSVGVAASLPHEAAALGKRQHAAAAAALVRVLAAGAVVGRDRVDLDPLQNPFRRLFVASSFRDVVHHNVRTYVNQCKREREMDGHTGVGGEM